MPAFPSVYAAAAEVALVVVVVLAVEEEELIALQNRFTSASLFLKHNENRYMRNISLGSVFGSVSSR